MINLQTMVDLSKYICSISTHRVPKDMYYLDLFVYISTYVLLSKYISIQTYESKIVIAEIETFSHLLLCMFMYHTVYKLGQ